MTVTVREATIDDALGMYRLWQAMVQHNASVDRRIVPSPVSEQEFATALHSTLSRANATAFVADDEGAVVGFVSGGVEQAQPDRLPEKHMTIGYFYVEPAYRRMGLGRKLFRAIADWAARQKDVDHFEMTVLASDREASAFWRELGFTPFIERLWAPLSAVDEQ